MNNARRDIRALFVGTRFMRMCLKGSSARVLSVHRKVINLICEDELLALALPQAGGSSRFLCLNVLPEVSPQDELHLTATAVVTESQRIDLCDTPVWKGPFDNSTHATLAPEQYAAFADAMVSLNIKPGASPNCALTPDTVARWIGLGPGLTPAGDDVILGYLAIDNHLSDDFSWTLSMHAAVLCELKRTTTLSSQLLRAAIDCDYHESVGQVLAVLCNQSSENLLTALRRLEAIGASSGQSTIYGMWLAICRIFALGEASIFPPLEVPRKDISSNELRKTAGVQS